ncbi:MAG: TRAP transporter small permease subunit [Bacteroidetes bacterium]|nr:MAG: TRAP transporter small permease subunit [Bacteroidota bacterium]
MQRVLRMADRIDRVSEWLGRAMTWLTLAMVLVGAYNAVVRYLDRYTGLGLSSNFYIELQWYLFSLVFLLGASYTLRHDAHVRVDVLYGRLSRRGQAWVNVLGTVLMLMPFCGLVLWTSGEALVRGVWAVDEMSPDPGGLPRFPIRLVIPLAFVLLLLQGVAFLLRELAVLLRPPAPPAPPPPPAATP